MADNPDIQAQIDAAVAAATAPLNEQIADLTSKLSQSDLEGQVAAVQAELEKVQAALDEKAAELTASKAAYDTLVADLEAIEAARVEADEKAAVTAERVAAVEALNVFEADHIAANADRWGAFTAEHWGDQIAEYEALAARLGASAPAPNIPLTDPSGSALTASAGSEVLTADADVATDVSAVIDNRVAVANLAA